MGSSTPGLALANQDSLCWTVCSSTPEGCGLPCVLNSLMDPGRVVDFSVYLAFHLFLGQSGNFQAHYYTAGTRIL